MPLLSSSCKSVFSVTMSENRTSSVPLHVPVSASETSGSSEMPSTSSSLPSNLSILTYPSVSSLQKSISDSDSDCSFSYVCLSSLRPRHHPCHVSTLTLSSPSFLYSASSSSEITVWDLTTFSPIDFFNGSGSRSSSGSGSGLGSRSGSVKSIVFSNGRVFTAHQDGKIRVWEAGTEAGRPHRHLATLPTAGDRLLRCLLPKNYVRVRRHKRRLWVEHADAVSSLGVAAGNGLLYSVSWDKSLKVWRTSDLRCLESVPSAHNDAVNAVAVHSDGTVYTASADGRIRVWAKPFGGKRHSLVATLEKHKSSVNALALAEDGSVLYSGAKDRSILVWEREDSANHMVVTGALRGHRGAILCLINVGDLLFSGSADRTVRIWRRGREGRYGCLAVMEGHEKGVKALSAAWDDNARAYRVCSGGLDGEIKVWQVWPTNPSGSSVSDSFPSDDE